jgi:hypothetical protein
MRGDLFPPACGTAQGCHSQAEARTLHLLGNPSAPNQALSTKHSFSLPDHAYPRLGHALDRDAAEADALA